MTESLADWEVGLLLPVINEGDVVRAERGGRVIQDVAVAEAYSEGLYVLGRRPANLVRDGYSVTVVRKAPPKLPTEPGVYRGVNWVGVSPALCYTLNARGEWFTHYTNGDTEETDGPSGGDLPLVRLVPEVVTS
jgi:hypothetical protein